VQEILALVTRTSSKQRVVKVKMQIYQSRRTQTIEKSSEFLSSTTV
jgi:hypothetical protein